MKAHTSQFKEKIKEFGREIDSKITYTINNEEIELGNEDLNSVLLHYEGGILKSVMKQLDIDSNVEIPLETILTYEFGVKVGNEYEYINYGNFIVYKVEKQEDTNSYKITCYDKMLYSMKNYTDMNLIYPMTIRNYIIEVCDYLGLTFANINDNFANYNREIPYDLYLDSQGNSLGYTFRDVLDELAQVTASTICINDDDELEIRYITNTNDTIDEEYLKDVNVNFGEKYGPVNSIVLSRSAESDNVYLKDDTSIENDGLCEIKIVDNQIMNRNDRSDYLAGIFLKLGGLEYYLNDFSSTGICYYDICDRYNISIGENAYSCVMFNDEINITQGLEENIFTEIPDQGETDYTKADKTDRKINQTYFIVDKQNQQIESMISTVDEQNTKIAHITQSVDEINSKISDAIDLTVSGETNSATIDIDNINASEPIQIVVKPIISSITNLYPATNLYPNSTLYPQSRTLRFYNRTTSENIDYMLPDDLLYYDSENYDEFTLDYGDGTPLTQICRVTKKCKYKADGTIELLPTPQTINYTYPSINLTNGDYTISLLGATQGYFFVRLMAQNIYTTQFYTKAETNSIINQTELGIMLEVNEKVDENEIIASINTAIENEQGIINITGNQITIDSDNFSLDAEGNINAKSGVFSGSININADDGVGDSSVDSKVEIYNSNTLSKTNIYPDGIVMEGDPNSQYPSKTTITRYDVTCRKPDDTVYSYMAYDVIRLIDTFSLIMPIHQTKITAEYVHSPEITQTSSIKVKKNIEKLKSGLDIIKNIDIYKYHLVNQKDNEKKHIGFVIGEDYNYSKEITSKDNENVDLYSFISVCCQAIKEQQKIIEELQQRIEKLERESDK